MTEPGSTQWCHQEEKDMSTNQNTDFHLKVFFTVKTVKVWQDCPERPQHLNPLRYSKSNGMCSSLTCSRNLCLTEIYRLGNLKISPPNSALLQFYDSSIDKPLELHWSLQIHVTGQTCLLTLSIWTEGVTLSIYEIFQQDFYFSNS